MNTQNLLDQYFETAFSAPDGIKRLRELILSLAMQGKLVSQDPNDQPARELLQEIEAEKQRLIKAGKIKKQKPLPPIQPEEIPYELPESWKWVRLENIGEINPKNIGDDDQEAGFVPMPLISQEYKSFHKYEKRKWGEIKKGYTHFANGDVGLAKITPCFENGKSCIFHDLPNGIGAGTTELHIFRNTFNAIYQEYLLAYFKNSRYLQIGASQMTGTAGQKRVTKSFFAEYPFPLPPLAEQKRIVEKIDRLMEQCDKLEQLRKEQEQKRILIHTAAREKLLTAKEQETFGQAWDFIKENFGELYAVKENVSELRKAILQLAVMGKLVPQDPNDPPASELLKEIEAEKQRLIKEGKIKKQKPLPEITADEIFYGLPDSWEWCLLRQISLTIDYGTSQKTCKDSSKIPVYRMGNIVNGRLIDINLKYIDPNIDDLPRLFLQKNDILFNRTNSYELVGKSALYDGEDNTKTFASYLIRIQLEQKNVFPRFVNLAMNAPYFRETQIEPEITQQCGQANFNGTKLSETLIPLPPLLEQHRIVAKVDVLMALCDQLENQIDQQTVKQTQLLEAVMAGV